MKNAKTCPKCGSCDLIIVSDTILKTVSNIIPIGWTKDGCVGLTRYVCGECGYTEEWIAKKEDIERVRAKFPNQDG